MFKLAIMQFLMTVILIASFLRFKLHTKTLKLIALTALQLVIVSANSQALKHSLFARLGGGFTFGLGTEGFDQSKDDFKAINNNLYNKEGEVVGSVIQTNSFNNSTGTYAGFYRSEEDRTFSVLYSYDPVEGKILPDEPYYALDSKGRIASESGIYSHGSNLAGVGFIETSYYDVLMYTLGDELTKAEKDAAYNTNYHCFYFNHPQSDQDIAFAKTAADVYGSNNTYIEEAYSYGGSSNKATFYFNEPGTNPYGENDVLGKPIAKYESSNSSVYASSSYGKVILNSYSSTGNNLTNYAVLSGNITPDSLVTAITLTPDLFSSEITDPKHWQTIIYKDGYSNNIVSSQEYMEILRSLGIDWANKDQYTTYHDLYEYMFETIYVQSSEGDSEGGDGDGDGDGSARSQSSEVVLFDHSGGLNEEVFDQQISFSSFFDSYYVNIGYNTNYVSENGIVYQNYGFGSADDVFDSLIDGKYLREYQGSDLIDIDFEYEDAEKELNEIYATVPEYEIDSFFNEYTGSLNLALMYGLKVSDQDALYTALGFSTNLFFGGNYDLDDFRYGFDAVAHFGHNGFIRNSNYQAYLIAGFSSLLNESRIYNLDNPDNLVLTGLNIGLGFNAGLGTSPVSLYVEFAPSVYFGDLYYGDLHEIPNDLLEYYENSDLVAGFMAMPKFASGIQINW